MIKSRHDNDNVQDDNDNVQDDNDNFQDDNDTVQDDNDNVQDDNDTVQDDDDNDGVVQQGDELVKLDGWGYADSGKIFLFCIEGGQVEPYLCFDLLNSHEYFFFNFEFKIQSVSKQCYCCVNTGTFN